MPTPRIVSLNIETEDDSTHFNLRYSTNGSTWSDFYTTGSALEDLSVSALTDGVYALDGLNNAPTGVEIAASNAGNWFTYRLKNAGGYGNWSVPFKALPEPDSYGPLANAAELLQDFKDLGFEFDMDAEALDTYLGRLLTCAMDYIRITPDAQALYVSDDLTAAQRRYLGQAERYLATAQCLESTAALKAMGLQAPLLVEDSQNCLATAKYFSDKAMQWITTLIAGLGDDPSEPGTFTIPSLFTVAHGCRGR